MCEKTNGKEMIWVEIEQRVVSMTDKAICVGGTWLPLSRIECVEIETSEHEKSVVDTPSIGQHCCAVKMEAWLARENDLRELEGF